MAIPTWPGVPTFYTGQVMSASAHLNRLSRAVRYLLGIYQSTQMAFPSFKHLSSDQGDWEDHYNIWEGHFRHKSDSLRITYRALAWEPIRFRIRYRPDDSTHDDVIVWEHQTGELSISIGTETTTSHTIDISPASLTADQFYSIEIAIDSTAEHGTGSSWILVLEVAEISSPSLPALPDCNDGDVLTADRWNDLSEYASALATAALSPRPGFPSRSSYHTNGLDSMFHGGFRYVTNTLRYQAWRKRSATNNEFRMWITDDAGDEIMVARQTSADPVSTAVDNIELSGTPFAGSDNYYPYYDMTDYHITDLSDLDLTPGGYYMLRAGPTEDESIQGLWSKASLDYIYQDMDAVPDMTGWTNPEEWEHGDYVGGTTGSPNVHTLRDDLEWLGARVTGINQAAHDRYTSEKHSSVTRDFELWLIRTHRWLWVLGESDDSPLLRYYADGWQEVSLPVTDTYKWHAYDLGQLPLLAQGQRYLVRGAWAAIEDTNA